MLAELILKVERLKERHNLTIEKSNQDTQGKKARTTAKKLRSSQLLFLRETAHRRLMDEISDAARVGS